MLVETSDVRPHWFVARTKPRRERLAVEHLTGRGFESYCPRVLEPRTYRSAPQGPRPLFPSYVFARLVLPESYTSLVYCPGIAGVVRFGTRVAAVEDEVIDSFKQREGDQGYLRIGKSRRTLPAGTRVRIVSGPLAGYEGLVDRYLPASDRVRVFLALVSGSRPAEIDASNVYCA